mmetsp:Transcript_30899/g.81120  ORF Transcript_30899/g.81120 Transcript_30899/m.81120 type:complete len:127 (-) Transcript_30899:1907-2287(-)
MMRRRNEVVCSCQYVLMHRCLAFLSFSPTPPSHLSFVLPCPALPLSGQNRFREMLVSRRIRLMTNIAALKIQDFMKRHFQKQQEKEEKEAEKAKSGRKGEKKESESKRPSGVHATTIKPPLRRSRS